MSGRRHSGRPSLSLNTRSSARARGSLNVLPVMDLSLLPPMSPLTDVSDLEEDIQESRTDSVHTAARASSSQKRKASPSSHDSPPPKRLKKQSGHIKRTQVSESTSVQHVTWKWNLTTLASRKNIFVRLNEHGIPAEHADCEGYWWPAKVINPLPMSQICVTLFGNDGHGRRTISFKASEGNTRLFAPKPFTKHDFASRNLLDRLAKAWTNACKYLSKDEKGIRDHDDELILSAPAPLPLPLLTPVSPMVATKRFKPPKIWTPPPPDPSIAIPGEKVLTRMPRSDKSSRHYPAIVKRYIQPTKPSHVPRYEVEFFTTQVELVERSYFFLRHEEGYHTCKIGHFTSNTVDDDDDDSDDSDDDEYPARRVRTPSFDLPALPLPDDGGLSFAALPLRTQLALVEPIMNAIINDAYPPAHDRHIAFMKGRKARKHLSQSAGIRGGLGAGEPGRVHRMILDWALQDEFSIPISRNISDQGSSALKSSQERIDTDAGHDGEDQAVGPSNDITNHSASNSPDSVILFSSMTAPNLTISDDTAASTAVSYMMTEDASGDSVKISTTFDVSSGLGERTQGAPGFAASSPTRPDCDNLHDRSHSWPLHSISSRHHVETPSTSSHDTEALPCSPRDNGAFPTVVLPLGQLSPLIEQRSYSDDSQTLSPESESAAETRVDEPSPAFLDTLKLRQRGCPLYEALSHHERHLYCLDVLFYEVVIQLVLWRSGKRTAPEPLEDVAAEEALYDEGVALVQQQESVAYKWSWIDDIVPRRRRIDKKKPRPIVRETTNGRSLRPVAKQISYVER